MQIFVGHLALARVLDCAVILATGKAEVKKSIGLITHLSEPKCQISYLYYDSAYLVLYLALFVAFIYKN